MLGRRTDVLAGAGAVAAVCVLVTSFFAQPLFTSQTVQAVTEHGGDPDVANVFQPLNDFQYRYVRAHGSLPEWIDAMSLGTPEIELGTTTNAYLPRLAAMRIASSPQSAADILAWLASVVAALGVLALARLYGLAWGAAVLAATSYSLAHIAIRWLPFFALPVFMAAFPYVLLGVELIWRRRFALGAATTVAAFGIGGLGGSVLFSQLAIQAVALLALHRFAVARTPLRARLVCAGTSILVAGVGLIAGSGGWIPFALSQRHSLRRGTSFDAIGGMDWTTIRSLVDPAAQRASDGINGDLYVSLVAPILIVVGIAVSVRRRRLGFIPVYALLILLIGLKTPLLRALIAFVPGWQYLSSAERYASFLAVLPLALFAGIGADALVRHGRRGLLVSAALIAVSGTAWELEMPSGTRSAVVLALALVVTAVLVAAALTRWRRVAVVVPIAFAGLGVLAGSYERNLGWHPVADKPDAIYRPWLGLVSTHDDPQGRWMSYCQPLTYAADPRQSFTFRPNTFLDAPGIWLDAFVSFPRADYFAYWQRLTGSTRYSRREFGSWFQHTPDDPPPNLSLVNAAGISRILGSSACTRAVDPAWHSLASTVAAPTPRVDTVYDNSAAYPIAYVSHRWRQATSRDQALQELAAPANRRFADHTDSVATTSASSGGNPVAARLRRVGGSALDIALPPSREAGMLIVLDLYDANWHAYVDGRRERVLRADGVFRGVPVPPGARAVTLRYEPWWTSWLFPLCWGLIAAALTAVLVALGRDSRRRRSSAGAKSAPSVNMSERDETTAPSSSGRGL